MDWPDEAGDWTEWLLRGGFAPAVTAASEDSRNFWFAGYAQTYLERDLRQLSAVSSLPDFQRLMALAAHRIGRLPWGWLLPKITWRIGGGGALYRPRRTAARRCAQARTTVMRRPWGLDCSLLDVRSRIGGRRGRRSKITSQPVSSPNPAR